MTAAHTPDRLFVAEGRANAEVCRMKDGREFVVARISSRETLAISQEERDDARRLVACWNACEGISTEELEARAAIAQAQGAMTRDEAIAIAKKAAWDANPRPSYVPAIPSAQEWADWMPHEWVVDAVMAAATPQQAEPLNIPAIRLTRNVNGVCVVALCVEGKEIPVIRDAGDFISHYVEQIGIESVLKAHGIGIKGAK